MTCREEIPSLEGGGRTAGSGRRMVGSWGDKPIPWSSIAKAPPNLRNVKSSRRKKMEGSVDNQKRGHLNVPRCRRTAVRCCVVGAVVEQKDCGSNLSSA